MGGVTIVTLLCCRSDDISSSVATIFTRVLSERVYQFESVDDQLPSTTVQEPRADEAVLSSAVIGIIGAGRDDVALDWLELRYRVLRDSSFEDGKVEGKAEVKPSDGAGDQTGGSKGLSEESVFTQVRGPQARLRVAHTLDALVPQTWPSPALLSNDTSSQLLPS